MVTLTWNRSPAWMSSMTRPTAASWLVRSGVGTNGVQAYRAGQGGGPVSRACRAPRRAAMASRRGRRHQGLEPPPVGGVEAEHVVVEGEDAAGRGTAERGGGGGRSSVVCPSS